MVRFTSMYDSKDDCYALIDGSKVSAVVGPYKKTRKFLWLSIEQYWIIEIHIDGKVISMYCAFEETANNWRQIIARDW